jgi:hypothetical protein
VTFMCLDNFSIIRGCPRALTASFRSTFLALQYVVSSWHNLSSSHSVNIGPDSLLFFRKASGKQGGRLEKFNIGLTL